MAPSGPSPEVFNAVDALLDRNIANGLADKPAFVDEERTLTYGALQTATCAAANAMAGLDLRPGQVIAMLMADTVDFPVVFWAALRAGCVPVCLNTLLQAENYAYILNDSHARALFVSADLLAQVEPLLAGLPDLENVIVVGGKKNATYPRLEDFLAQSSTRRQTAPRSPEDVAFWLYTSGSTGAPKGVRHKHSSLVYVAEHYGRLVLEIRSDDICFSAAKLFFAYGMGAGMAIPMSVGATTVLMEGRPTAERVLSMMARYQPTLFFGVPTLYASMLADLACTRENGSRKLRLCVSAGEALPADLGRKWRACMGVDVLDGVGSTEMLNTFLSNRPDDVRYGASGKAVPGYEVRLVDETGQDPGRDEIGEMLVRGGSAALDYWNQPEKSRETFQDGWVRTGDKYVCDSAGYYHYCGRTDDMFKVSGKWVSPFEVEQALVSHPEVLEAAVVGRADKSGTIKPHAFIVLDGATASKDLDRELKDRVKAQAGLWKYPRWIDYVEALPKTATGKIQRHKLRRDGGPG